MTRLSDDDDTKRRRAKEAASILRRLDEDPENEDALRDRDAFLARGDAETRIYLNISRAVAATTTDLRKKTRRNILLMIGATSASLYLTKDTLRIAVLSDYQTARVPEDLVLQSGDRVALDAASAIRDRSTDQLRRITLMTGAAYFETVTDDRSFMVEAADVTIQAVGTAFSVSRLGKDTIVSVTQGAVEVKRGPQMQALAPGQQVRVSPVTMTRGTVDLGTVGSWRNDILTMDGMTLAEVASVIERRLPGRVYVFGEQLRNARLAGGLDLKDPLHALRILAATGGGLITQASRFLVVIRSV